MGFRDDLTGTVLVLCIHGPEFGVESGYCILWESCGDFKRWEPSVRLACSGLLRQVVEW